MRFSYSKSLIGDPGGVSFSVSPLTKASLFSLSSAATNPIEAFAFFCPVHRAPLLRAYPSGIQRSPSLRAKDSPVPYPSGYRSRIRTVVADAHARALTY